MQEEKLHEWENKVVLIDFLEGQNFALDCTSIALIALAAHLVNRPSFHAYATNYHMQSVSTWLQ